MTKKIWQDKYGRWICSLQDDKYPYSSVTAIGIDSVDAEQKAIQLRHDIIEAQLSVKPVKVQL